MHFGRRRLNHWLVGNCRFPLRREIDLMRLTGIGMRRWRDLERRNLRFWRGFFHRFDYRCGVCDGLPMAAICLVRHASSAFGAVV